MPLPINSIRGIEFSLRNIPKDISEAEKQRLIALTAINYVGSLGRAVSFLSASKLCHSEGIPLDRPEIGWKIWILPLSSSAICKPA